MMKTNTILKAFVFVIVLLASAYSYGQSVFNKQGHGDDNSKVRQYSRELDKLLSTYNEYDKFNGSVLVADEGKVVFKKGFGYANMEWEIPNESDTKFRIASITKQFTAMLIMQLVASDSLDLHKPISNYLPDYPKYNAEKISIHQLLTHTSGTPRVDDFINYRVMQRNHYSPSELMQVVAEAELNFPPGEKFVYSNEGYTILGAIIEKIMGTSYENALQEKIFTPLQMLNSGYDHHQTILSNRAAPYTRMYDGTYKNSDFLDMSIPYSAGSIYSTVEDLFLWDQALYTEQLLPQKYMNMLFDTYVSAFNGRHYGYGWIIGEMPIGNTKERVQTQSHSGGMDGVRTHLTRIPSNKSLVILLGNTDRTPLFEINSAIIGIINDASYDFPKKSIANALLELINEKGRDEALTFFNEVQKDDAYYLDEEEMNVLSYKFIQNGKPDIAVDILEMALSAYPEAFNLYDSYGEVLLVLGNKEKAIANYQKSIELNPNNKNAVRILKKLGIE